MKGRTGRRATLFVDAAAPAAQRRAGLRWLRNQYANTLGRVIGEHEIAIDFFIDADAIALKLGDILQLAMRPARIPEDTETWGSLVYDPLIPLATSHLGTTLHIRYAGPDLKVNLTRDQQAITGYYGTFSVP